jgi:hypothetical protein
MRYLNPRESLKPNTKYIATLSKDIKDISGRLLNTEKICSFLTGIKFTKRFKREYLSLKIRKPFLRPHLFRI